MKTFLKVLTLITITYLLVLNSFLCFDYYDGIRYDSLSVIQKTNNFFWWASVVLSCPIWAVTIMILFPHNDENTNP